MSSQPINKSYKELLIEVINNLGGKATILEIFYYIENRYKKYIEGKKTKTWKNTVRYTLTTKIEFFQKPESPLHSFCRGDYWYIRKELESPRYYYSLEELEKMML